MAYTVLARKYRSWTFEELVGQEAIATTLRNAITSERVHHGFLFCGTRGVGKTSAARILARCLNCLSSPAPTIHPCRTCESCEAIAEGQDLDVLEIDAASNTGVDDIRVLRSNTNYQPARARFKIYIIDEVHMLSAGAFNALLKTLEEPPEHVKFILATTEPQKVPATIQSRCLRFNFRTISVDEIARQLEAILKDERAEAEEGVVRRVARLARGSMRDALSLLDQLLSMGRDRLTGDMIDDVLPTPHDEVLMRLIGQVADRDAAGALLSLETCMSGGYSLERFTEALAEQVRTLLLLRVCGAETALVELPSSARQPAVALSERFDADACVYMIAVLEELSRRVRYSALGRALVEAGLVRLAGAVRYQSIQRLLDELGPPVGDVEVEQAAKAATVSQPAGPPPAAAPRPAAPPVPGKEPASTEQSQSGPDQAGVRRPVRAPARRRAAAAPPAAAPSASGTPPTEEEVRAATAEPLVREAMDLFDGSLVNVEKAPRAGRSSRKKV